MLAYVLQGVGLGFSAAAQPGPFQTYLLSRALTRGWRGTLPVALAPLISDGPIIALVLLVLSRVPDWMRQALYIASGLFILYLAWGAYCAWCTFDVTAPNDENRVPGSPGRTPSELGTPFSERQARSVVSEAVQAALMNAISPGPYIYWSLVTGPILVSSWREAPGNGIGFLVGFYGAMVGCLAGMIVLFGTARQLGPKVSRLLLGISVLALAGFGAYQLWQGIVG